MFSLSMLRRSLQIRQCRLYTSAVDSADLRSRLMFGVKAAMKRKDSFTSTTLRSVLSDVYNADKTASNGSVTSSDIAGILRKAVQRRMEAAHKFEEASRPELAENEKKEAEILSEFLPPLLSEAAIDQILQEALKDLSKDTDSRKSLGLLFKSFYSKVDKSTVDADLVRKRAEILLAARSTP